MIAVRGSDRLQHDLLPLFLSCAAQKGYTGARGRKVGQERKMINFKVNDADRILFIEMKGMISEADIDGAIDALQAHYPAVGVHLRGGGERGSFSVLADWQDLEGWEKGAKTLGTITTKTVGDAIHKIAVIADVQFDDEQPRLMDVAPRAIVRFFPPRWREDALAWLRS
jgi:SpoIIAA-like